MIGAMIGTISFAQVIFQVQAPASLAANYSLDYAEPAPNGAWGNLDLNDPANSITGTLEFVATDTTACVALTASLTGKIAVLYRGACEFGVKALNAENQGAIGVIIINNVPSPATIVPGAGVSGPSVTIPVIMISQADGALLRNEIVAGNVTAFIGSKLGLFPDDLGARRGDIVLAERASNIELLSQNASEFSVVTGLWVRNYGNQSQSGATVAVDIDMGATNVYTNSVAVPTLASGDSVYIGLGVFSQSTYAVGNYDMTYTITTATTDGDPSDNVLASTFRVDPEIYTYGLFDASNELVSPAGYRPATYNDYENCVVFRDANASRVVAKGVTFSASTSGTDVLTNELIQIRAYQWDDVFTDLNDANYGMTSLQMLDQVFYAFPGDYQDSNIYIPLSQSLSLVDNQRYLFCFFTASTTLFLGFNDANLDYLATQDTLLQPMFPSTIDGNSSNFANGFGTDIVPAISVTMGNAVGINDLAKENEITPFPNPTANMLSIPVGKRNGAAVLKVVDVTGKVVLTENVNFNNNDILTVDVSAIDNGLYIFNMTFDNGSTNSFNVVVNR